jgi:hypothetical protein
MNKTIISLSILSLALIFTGCSDKEKKQSLTEGGMKCGAGKCGASMVDGSAVLVSKKMNVLNQLSKTDSRRDCILKAKTSKSLYNCVRDIETGRLTIKEQNNTFKNKIDLKKEKKVAPLKETGAMKCEAGKCGS